MICWEDELILPAKKKKKSAVPKPEVEEKVEEIEETPRATVLAAPPSWTEFDFPKRKKRKREVR